MTALLCSNILKKFSILQGWFSRREIYGKSSAVSRWAPYAISGWEKRGCKIWSSRKLRSWWRISGPPEHRRSVRGHSSRRACPMWSAPSLTANGSVTRTRNSAAWPLWSHATFKWRPATSWSNRFPCSVSFPFRRFVRVTWIGGRTWGSWRRFSTLWSSSTARTYTTASREITCTRSCWSRKSSKTIPHLRSQVRTVPSCLPSVPITFTLGLFLGCFSGVFFTRRSIGQIGHQFIRRWHGNHIDDPGVGHRLSPGKSDRLRQSAGGGRWRHWGWPLSHARGQRYENWLSPLR